MNHANFLFNFHKIYIIMKNLYKYWALSFFSIINFIYMKKQVDSTFLSSKGSYQFNVNNLNDRRIKISP